MLTLLNSYLKGLNVLLLYANAELLGSSMKPRKVPTALTDDGRKGPSVFDTPTACKYRSLSAGSSSEMWHAYGLTRLQVLNHQLTGSPMRS